MYEQATLHTTNKYYYNLQFKENARMKLAEMMKDTDN